MWIPNLASILSVRSYQGKITLKNLLYNKPTILLALAQISFMSSDQRIYLITYRNMNCWDPYFWLWYALMKILLFQIKISISFVFTVALSCSIELLTTSTAYSCNAVILLCPCILAALRIQTDWTFTTVHSEVELSRSMRSTSIKFKVHLMNSHEGEAHSIPDAQQNN